MIPLVQISLVIPCLNALSYLQKLWESLKKQQFKNFEVIVIDNNSGDNTAEWIKKNDSFFHVVVIREKVNTGYAAAVNRGIKSAFASKIVVLNADLLLEPSFLKEIYSALEKDASNLYSCHIKNITGDMTESVGVYLDGFLRAHPALSPGKILGPQGAAFAFNKKLLEDLKIPSGLLFDERYFFLWEDVELALRSHRRGIKTVFLSNAVCRHMGNSSKSRYFYKQYLSLRNRYYLIKNYYPFYVLKYFYVVFLYDIPRIIFFLICNPNRFKLLFMRE